MAKQEKKRNRTVSESAVPPDVKLTRASAEEWARLAKGIPLERGPRLLFVIVDSPSVRRTMAQHLARSLTESGTRVEIIELCEPLAQPLEEILKRAQQLPNADAQFVLGLDTSLLPGEHSVAAFADLNFHRDRIPMALHAPVVFWLDSWAFKTLALRAPDFMSWRSSEFRIVEDEGPMSEPLSRYRTHVMDRFSKLTLYSVTSDKPLAVDLERVFVKLTATEREVALQVLLKALFESRGKEGDSSQFLVPPYKRPRHIWNPGKQSVLWELKEPSFKELTLKFPDYIHSADLFPTDSIKERLTVRLDRVSFRALKEVFAKEAQWPDDISSVLSMGALTTGVGRSAIGGVHGSRLTAAAFLKHFVEADLDTHTAISLSITLGRHNNLAVLGAPGSGKTTLLRYLALSFARRQAEQRLGLHEDRLPIYITLRDFSKFLDTSVSGALAQPAPSALPILFDYLTRYYDDCFPHLKLPADFFENVLRDHKCVLLLDGLDEVANLAKRSYVAAMLAGYAATLAGTRFVLTSRPRGYESAGRQSLSSSFVECTIRDLDDEQIKSFITNWYLAVTLDREGDTPTSRDQSVTRAKDLLGALQNDRVRTLATNPLLLSILALIHQRGNQLPHRRVALYEECIEFLLGFWDQVKQGEAGSDLAQIEEMTRNEKRVLVEPIALWLHGRGENAGEVSRKELETRLAEEFRYLYNESHSMAARRAASFADMIAEQAGLMVEREAGVFAFAHLTFQEFLAARALADRRDYVEVAQKHLHNAWWREVITLLAGYVSSPCTRRSREETTELLSSVAHAGSPLEQSLHRDLLFAFRCLCDVEHLGVEDRTRRQLAGEVFALWENTKINALRSDLLELFRYAAPTPVGPTMVNMLLKLLEHVDASMRSAAAGALECFGRTATTEESICAMARLTKDSEEYVRVIAAHALGTLVSTMPFHEITSYLPKLDSDAALLVRGRAAIALASSSAAEPSEKVLAQLLEFSRDSSNYVRLNATVAIGRLGEAASTAQVVFRLLDLTRDADDLIRAEAVEALARFGRSAATAEVIGRLVELTRDPDDDVCGSAAKALERLGATATVREIISELIDSTRDSRPDVRSNATTALGRLHHLASTPEVVSRMMELSEEWDVGVRYAATLGLGRLTRQTATTEIVSRLLDLSRDQNLDVKHAAARSLSWLSAIELRPGVVLRLVELVRDPEPIVGSAAAHGLGRLNGKPITEVLPKLVELINEPDSDVRDRTLMILENWRGSTPTADVIERLIQMSRDPKPEIRGAAAYALGVLASSASLLDRIVFRLLELTLDAVRDVRHSAAVALGRVEAIDLPMELLDRVFDLVNSDDVHVSANAAVFLSQPIANLKPRKLMRLVNFWKGSLSSHIEGLFGWNHGMLSSVAYDQLKQLTARAFNSPGNGRLRTTAPNSATKENSSARRPTTRRKTSANYRR